MNPPSDRQMNDSTLPPPKNAVSKQANSDNKKSSLSTTTNKQPPATYKLRTDAPRTVNPRTQHRNFRKGFALSDWNLLVRQSKDLAQLKGKGIRRDISKEEIKQHNQVHDGWIILRGKVYNIGPYLAYHPGGIEIFQKYKLLGRDATALFDKYHRWVNIDGLIGTLLVGTVDMTSVATTPSSYNKVIPTKEAILPLAPRLPTSRTSTSSALLQPSTNGHDDDQDEDLLPPPPARPTTN